MGRSRYRTYANDTRPYFMTCTIVEWYNLLALDTFRSMVMKSLAFLIRNNRITLHAYVLMKNHMHLIASGSDVSRQIGLLKRYTAARFIGEIKHTAEFTDVLGMLRTAKKQHKGMQEYQVWQEGCHPMVMFNRRVFKQKLDYIHRNPVRAGYTIYPEEWPWCSYRYYVDDCDTAGLADDPLIVIHPDFA